MEVEGDVNNDAHWPLRPQKIPTASRELPSLLYTVSPLFVVLKMVLCKSNLCVGCACHVAWGSQLELGRHLWHLGYWPARLEWLLAERPVTYGDVPLSLLAPYSEAKGSKQCSWEPLHCSNLAGRPKHPKRAPALSKWRRI